MANINIKNVADRVNYDYLITNTSQIGYGKGYVNNPFNSKTGAITMHNYAYASNENAESIIKAIYNGGVNRWNRGIAHAYVTADTIYLMLPYNIIPYAVGYESANTDNYSIEIIDKGSEEDIKKAIDLACCWSAYLLKENGLKWSNINDQLHQEYTSTACPWELVQRYGSVKNVKSNIKKKVDGYMNETQNTGSSVKGKLKVGLYDKGYVKQRTEAGHDFFKFIGEGGDKEGYNVWLCLEDMNSFGDRKKQSDGYYTLDGKKAKTFKKGEYYLLKAAGNYKN